MWPSYLFVFLLLLLDLCQSLLTAEQRSQLLDLHNYYRRQEAVNNRGAGMIKLEWDNNLETVAQYFADKGPFNGHNSDASTQYAALVGSSTTHHVGENWYSGAPTGTSSPLPTDAVHAWVDFVWPAAWTGQPSDCSERQAFNNQCTGMTGHFTQVLWENTAKVGCGYTSTHGTTCNYFRGGNIIGQSHFQQGAACTKCPPTHPHCVDSLCSSSPTSPTSAPSPTTSTSAPTSAPTTTTTDCTITDWKVNCPDGYMKTCNGMCYSPINLIQDLYQNNFAALLSYGLDFNCPRLCCEKLTKNPCGQETGALGDQEGVNMVRKGKGVYYDDSSASILHLCYWSSLILVFNLVNMF